MNKKVLFFVFALCATTMFAQKQVTVNCGESVTMTATPKTGYHFLRWQDYETMNPRTIAPGTDTTYKAFFEINKYTIVFRNWNMDTLQNETLEHFATVSYKNTNPTPTKEANVQYNYTFAGWNPTILNPATGDATYTAQFDSTLNKYKISFLNWDSTVIEAKSWDYGALPSYIGTPTRATDDSCTYTFSSWDKQIVNVVGEEKYVAQYSSSRRTFNLTTAATNGTTSGDGEYSYGTKVTLTATPNSCYEFVQWNDGNTNATRQVDVKSTITYTATFQKIQYTVTVESENDSQGEVKVEKVY